MSNVTHTVFEKNNYQIQCASHFDT